MARSRKNLSKLPDTQATLRTRDSIHYPAPIASSEIMAATQTLLDIVIYTLCHFLFANLFSHLCSPMLVDVCQCSSMLTYARLFSPILTYVRPLSLIRAPEQTPPFDGLFSVCTVIILASTKRSNTKQRCVYLLLPKLPAPTDTKSDNEQFYSSQAKQLKVGVLLPLENFFHKKKIKGIYFILARE